MSRRTVSAIVLAAACSAVLASAGSTATPRSGTLLSGVVSSVEEGPMEGVLVTAKADGSTIATTVVSDAKGRYAFPAGRLKPGQYTIRVRAIGYDLTGGSHTSVDAGKRAAFDIRLAKTADLAAQLYSVPADGGPQPPRRHRASHGPPDGSGPGSRRLKGPIGSTWLTTGPATRIRTCAFD